ncbi:LysR family transcriptional regulator [Aliiruegeria sabulilitoris]|uniref:LysR family transcriptional regulator n=1 Tax=Aliiruegeria sabulilitoris TaxID=1510458 RepID=UPI0008341494|nr:LysR family transcriptional regulator [Aliiruegeria sabulilitoris]NDR57350.1 LysR family transcriptional regulator [Pseudoruegeria sp. M32A2M]
MARKAWHSLPEYEAFRALMETGTTTAAAARLGLSQSAISRSIAHLEGRQGSTLFERNGGRLRPTDEAMRLNRRLDPLFEALNRIDGPSEPFKETLRLIAPPSYAHRYLVSLIASFLQANPAFYVSLEVAPADDVIRGVLEDNFDLGMTGVELSRAGVRLDIFRRSPAVCAMPKGHPLSERQSVGLLDLDGQRLITLSHRHARRGQMDRILLEAGSQPLLVAEVATSFAAADLAREGLGLAVVNPFPVAIYETGGLEFRRFESPISYRTYFVQAEHRPLPRIARAFMRHARLFTPADGFST